MGLTLKVSVEHERAIRRHAERTYPEECCGFLFGKTEGEHRELEVVTEIENEREGNRERRFLIGPEVYRRAELFAWKHKLELLGFYHSHPDHPAIPSEFDREHALPFTSYVIVSVRKGKSQEMRSWQLKEDRSGYTEEAVAVEEGRKG